MSTFKKSVIAAAVAVCGFAFAASAEAATFSYSTDFNSGVGSEWSISGNTTNQPGILGQLYDASETATLSLNSPGSSTALGGTLVFDLLGFASLDGGQNCCTDTFDLSVNGVTVFSASFDMGGGGITSVYYNPNGATFVTSSFGYFAGGLTSITIPITIAAGLNTIDFWYGHALQGLSDEAWGLDNVSIRSDISVSSVPLPATLPLLAAAVAGIGGLSLRRRKAAA